MRWSQLCGTLLSILLFPGLSSTTTALIALHDHASCPCVCAGLRRGVVSCAAAPCAGCGAVGRGRALHPALDHALPGRTQVPPTHSTDQHEEDWAYIACLSLCLASSCFHSGPRYRSEGPAGQGGRVLLAGDAAHRFPPAGGFGMNTGLQVHAIEAGKGSGDHRRGVGVCVLKGGGRAGGGGKMVCAAIRDADWSCVWCWGVLGRVQPIVEASHGHAGTRARHPTRQLRGASMPTRYTKTRDPAEG